MGVNALRELTDGGGLIMSDPVLPILQAAAPGETSGLEIRLFGPMEVRIGSHPLPRLRSRKGLWLLALLVLRAGRDVERDWLTGTLWPDSDQAAGRHSLRQSLCDLRRALGAEAWRLRREEPRTLRLDMSGACVDVPEFDAAVARGDRESLEAAVRLYLGPLLEDCAEEWSGEERRGREQAYVRALERLAAAAAARGEPAAAASSLQRAVGADPYREDLQRALMEALAETGNPSGALLVYRQYSALLWREMAAAPAEETTALFRRLREASRARPQPSSRSRPSADSSQAPRRKIPLPLTELIGREEEVREVVDRLSHSRLVTLTGTGGIGKTRLALRVAEELIEDYADGTAFVSLATLSDPERVPDSVQAALGVPADAAPQETMELLRRYLAPRCLLLVLDNCEHLFNACALLAEALLSECPGLRILATSRQPLAVHGETVWRVPSLSLPEESELWRRGSSKSNGGETRTDDAPSNERRTSDPCPLLQYAAVRLFVERARDAEVSFEITPHNALPIVQVCRRLDGIPLAIELAAARVRAMPVEMIAARLDDRFRLLTGGTRTALPRQQTLRASIDWSYDLLCEPERQVLQQLSVFAGGWTLEAAEAICDAQSVLDLLAGLVEKSLVVYQEREGRARYHLLETLRQYSSERLLEDGSGQAIRGRHLEYYLALAEEAEPHLTGARQREWLERLETEHDNLRAALASSLATPHLEAGLRLAAALWRFWTVRGYLTEGRERLAQALSNAPTHTASRAKALNAAGSLAYRQCDYQSARSLHEGGLAIYRDLRDRLGMASSLFALGRVDYVKGDHCAARSLYEASLAIYREVGDRSGMAGSLNNLGMVAYVRGEYESARSLNEESLAVYRGLGDRSGIAGSLHSLGLVAAAQGEYRSARSVYEKSLAIRRELGERSGIANSLIGLGLVAYAQGEHGTARSLNAESLTIYRELGNPYGIAYTLHNLGRVACSQRDFAAAHALQVESLTIRRELGDRFGIAASLEAMAALACEELAHPGGGEGDGTGGLAPQVAAAGLLRAGRRAARLLGAAEALRETIGAPLLPSEQEPYRREAARVRELLDEGGAPEGAERGYWRPGERLGAGERGEAQAGGFAAAWAEGRAMTLDQAIRIALEEAETPSLPGDSAC